MSRLDTLYQVADWVKMIRKNTNPGTPIILGGTKKDLIQQEYEEGAFETAWEIIEEQDLSCFIPTSSKTGWNVQELMQYIVCTLLSERSCREPQMLSAGSKST